MIPKTIYQTHEYLYQDMPKFLKNQSSTWTICNKEYDYVYYDKNQRREYVKKYYPEIMQAYDSINKPFQADIWRYLILYNNGGFYVDMDSICLSSIDDQLLNCYLNHEVVCVSISPIAPKGSNAKKQKGYVNNWFFGCTKGSKIIKKVLEKTIDVAINDPNMLGPGIYSDVLIDNIESILPVLEECGIHSEILKFDNNIDFSRLKYSDTKNTVIYNIKKQLGL